ADVSPERIVEGIAGRRMDGALAYRARAGSEGGEVLLDVRHVTAGPRVRDVTFTIRAGEIVGLAGLMGSGRTELARVLFGIDRIESGEVRIRGRKVRLASAQSAIDAGIALIPEDRREQGLVLEHSVRENLLLPLLGTVRRGPFLDVRAGRALAASLIERS